MVVLHVVVVGRGLGGHHFDVVRLCRLRVQLVQLRLGHVVYDACTVGVAHHVHRGPESVPVQKEGWRRGFSQIKSLFPILISIRGILSK